MTTTPAPQPVPTDHRRLQRPRRGRMIAGVCAGLADYLGVSATTVRIVAVLSCLLPGPQFVAYLVLWLVMPAAPERTAWTQATTGR